MSESTLAFASWDDFAAGRLFVLYAKHRLFAPWQSRHERVWPMARMTSKSGRNLDLEYRFFEWRLQGGVHEVNDILFESRFE